MFGGVSYYAQIDHGSLTVEVVGNDGTYVWGRYDAGLCPCAPSAPGGACMPDTQQCQPAQGRFIAPIEE